jgi:hypothetical protein
MRKAHETICRTLADAASRSPGAGHGVWGGDILALLARADALVADVSSVTVDHLYLRPDAGLVLMDRGYDGGKIKAAEVPVARAATVMRADHVDGLSAAVADLLAANDTTTRAEVRREYFGDFAVGESTRRFQALIRDLVIQRDSMVATRRDATSISVDAAP